MPTNNKGQIFSLDFLISLVLVVLAIGILFRFIELESYNVKEATNRLELKQIALSASDNLVSNPDFLCSVNYGVQKIKLNNCINLGTEIDSKSLGISEKFGCFTKGITVNGCEADLSSDSKNVFSVKRIVVTAERELNKQEFESCKTQHQCSLIEKEILFKVWEIL